MKRIKNKSIQSAKKRFHKLKKFFRGFTIVELIVVISIIGTLASIILVSVSSYIGKSKDSRIKAEISEISKGAVMYYSNNFTYDGYEDTMSSFDAVQPGSEYEFATDDATAYVAYAKLATADTYWCVDSTGSKIGLENPPDEGVYTCTSGSGASCRLKTLPFPINPVKYYTEFDSVLETMQSVVFTPNYTYLADIEVEDDGSYIKWTFDMVGGKILIGGGHWYYGLSISFDGVNEAFSIHNNDGIYPEYPWGTHLYEKSGVTTEVSKISWIIATGERDVIRDGEGNILNGVYEIRVNRCLLGGVDLYWGFYGGANGFYNPNNGNSQYPNGFMTSGQFYKTTTGHVKDYSLLIGPSCCECSN